MQNYTPTVIVKETNGDKYILMRLQVLEDTVNIMNQGVVMANEAVAQVYDAQTNGTVPKTELNEAYKEGVNSYAG